MAERGDHCHIVPGRHIVADRIDLEGALAEHRTVLEEVLEGLHTVPAEDQEGHRMTARGGDP